MTTVKNLLSTILALQQEELRKQLLSSFKDIDPKIVVLENSQSDAFDAISHQATMIEEMKKDIKLLVQENIELRRNLPKPTRPVRNFTEFRTLAENGSVPDAI